MKNFEENYWEKRAGKYNKTSWVKNVGFINAFLGMLPDKPFNSILEVGIGTGALAEKVVENIGPLIGMDISMEMIAKINHPNSTALIGDAHKLEFDNHTFDLIYMRNVIHYIDNPDLVFSEIYRCLKPSGYFLFSQVVPPDDSISEEYDWLVGRDIHYPTQEEILKLFLQFSIIGQDNYILKKQSIMNWLNNTCNDQSERQNIINRHRRTSETYRSFSDFEETENDIMVNMKQFIIIGSK